MKTPTFSFVSSCALLCLPVYSANDASLAKKPIPSMVERILALGDNALATITGEAAWNVDCTPDEAKNRKALADAVATMEGEERTVGLVLLSRLPYTYTEEFVNADSDLGEAENEFADHRLQHHPDHLRLDLETFRSHLELSLRARKEFPWCAELSKTDFLKYVVAHRGTVESLEDWRALFWNNKELSQRVREFAKEYRAASNDEDKSDVFLRMVHYLNSEYLTGEVRYEPRGMPDLTCSALLEEGIGRCTDLTNAFIAVGRTYGVAMAGVRTIWWPRATSNHFWAAVHDPAKGTWYDIDAVHGGKLSPGYLTVGRRGNEIHAKVYWLDQDAVLGEIRTKLLGGKHPWPIQHYLVALPKVDRTDRYSPTGTIETPSKLEPGTPVYLCCWNGDGWRECAAELVQEGGMIRFEKVGARDGVLYVVMRDDGSGQDRGRTPVGRPGILTVEDGKSKWKQL